MRRPRLPAVVAAVVVVLGLAWVLLPTASRRPPPIAGQPSSSPMGSVPADASLPAPTPIDPARATVLPATADGVTEWPATMEIAAALGSPESDGAADAAAVRTILGEYRRILRGVPEGGVNVEITRALQGENPLRLRFLPLTGAFLNPAGEWIDRWGTAYDFHKLSGQRLDVRSAGPDGRLRTADDHVAPGDGDAPPL